MKRRHVLGFGIIVAAVFIAFCGVAFGKSLTPYVSFSEAIETSGTVQVKGSLVGAVSSLDEGYGITFDLQDDEGTTVTVVYPGMKPENIEHAESVVIIGAYEKLAFNAEKILVKCPSKYQAEEGL